MIFGESDSTNPRVSIPSLNGLEGFFIKIAETSAAVVQD